MVIGTLFLNVLYLTLTVRHEERVCKPASANHERTRSVFFVRVLRIFAQ